MERTENVSFFLNQRHKIMDCTASLDMKDANEICTLLEQDYLSFRDGELLESNQQNRRLLDSFHLQFIKLARCSSSER